MRLIVSAFEGSITDPEVGAHAIVNASNPEVGLGSGVSGAIRDACGGSAFQREVRRRLEEDFDSPLDVGDCLVTSGGSATAFRWVLHVPAVDYRRRDAETGKSTGPSRVARCFRSALDEATRLAMEYELVGQFVLGTSLLGAGHGGLGPVVSLDAMMRALRESLPETDETICRIVFATPVAADGRLVNLAAEKHGVPYDPRTNGESSGERTLR